MAQLRQGYPEIQKNNGEILQVTHNTPEEARLYHRKFQLTFPYLCDAERVVHETYGIRMGQPDLVAGMRSFVACSAAAASDLVLRGETTPSPAPYFKRYGFHDSPQAIFIIDRNGIVRSVYTSGPIGSIRFNADLVRELATLQ